MLGICTLIFYPLHLAAGGLYWSVALFGISKRNYYTILLWCKGYARNNCTEYFYGRSNKLIEERLIELIDFMGYKPAKLAAETEVPLSRWKDVYYGRIRAGGDHIEAATKLWPDYAYWLTTGLTLPKAGQISPEIEKARSN